MFSVELLVLEEPFELDYFPMTVGLMVLIGLAVFFWKRDGPGSGRAFGNRIARHIGVPRKVFHALLESGAKGSSRELLASLEASKTSLDDASLQLGPVLSRGIERMEGRFGPQEMYDNAKPTVARLVAEFERRPSNATLPT